MRLLRLLGLGTLIALGSAPAPADDVFWIGGSGDWDDDASWSTGFEPRMEDRVGISDGDTVEVSQAGEMCAELELATLESARLNIGFTGGFDVTGLARVGAGGKAIVSQLGGTVTMGRLEIRNGSAVICVGGVLGLGSCTIGGSAIQSALQMGGTCTVAEAFEIDTNGVVSVFGSLSVSAPGGATFRDGGGMVVSRGSISLEGGLGTIEFPDFTAEATSLIRANVTDSGLNPIQVSGPAVLDGFLQVYDFGADEERYDVLVAESISGTFADVTLPSETWSWGIEDGTVFVTRGVTPVQTMTWGQLKSRRR